MPLVLRDYQIEAVESIWDYFENGGTGNPLVVHPTGCGKTLVISGFIKSVFYKYPDQKVMILTHSKELIDQNYKKLKQFWPEAPAGIYSAGLNKRDINNNIIFAGIASIAKRAEEFGKVDLILVDECDLISDSSNTMYQRFIRGLKINNPHLKIIGLTATPFRATSGHLIDDSGTSIFTDICHNMTTVDKFNRLFEEGYLLPLIPKRTDLSYDLSKIRMRGGEFVQKDMQDVIDREELTAHAIEECIQMASDRKVWLIFTTGIDHAINTANMLNDYGVSAKVVHSGNKNHKMSSSERDQVILDFKKGEFKALVNASILTVGFDHPPIDFIAILRPIGSARLFLQILGRGTRPMYADGFDLSTTEGRLRAIETSGLHDCLVADFGDNSRRLGPINDPVLPKKKGKKSGQPAPVKLCEGVTETGDLCNVWLHASLRICPHCGHEFVFESKLEKQAATAELIKRESKPLPVVETFLVTTITYKTHEKIDRPPMLKVSYYCGLRMFNEFVCFEHDGYAQRKARQWWLSRTDQLDSPEGDDNEAYNRLIAFPDSTADAISIIDQLPTPSHLRILTSKKYPEILDYCFDGGNFGAEDAKSVSVEVDVVKPDDDFLASDNGGGEFVNFDEDDIPF